MKYHIFGYFLVGFLIGIISFNLTKLKKISSSNANGFDGSLQDFKYSEEYVDENDVKTNQPSQNVTKTSQKILCVITTSEKNHRTKAIHIRTTWGKHCDKLIFASSRTDINLGAIGFNVVDSYDNLWDKVKSVFHYVGENFINDYDWIYKGDDDTFAVMENMRYMLSSYSPNDPIYFGHRFQSPILKYGYFSGGAGYVISNKALRLFVEKMLHNESRLKRNSWCHLGDDYGSEDLSMGKCLELSGVYPCDSRDPVKRDRFLPFKVRSHIFPPPPSFWYWSSNYYKAHEGRKCCSNYTVSTHYTDPRLMYSLYFLTYKLKVYGIQRQFPPVPKMIQFDDIVQAAENDRKVLQKNLQRNNSV